MKIPKRYLPVMPYIILKEAGAFHDLLKRVFGATDQLMVPGENGNIVHGEVRIGEAVIMFAQANDQWKDKTCGMFLYVESVDETLERARENRCKILYEAVQQDYGYTAGFEDPFGNQWWIVEGGR